jgi:hypothetical protein
MMYTPNDATGGQPETGDDPIGWRLLQDLTAVTRIVEEIAYNMRIISHLLATSDHRHLHAYADDMVEAVERQQEPDRQLRETAEIAATAWGVPATSPLSQVIAAAPDVVRNPLSEELARLQAITTELQADGDVSRTMLDRAVKIVSQRCRALESAGDNSTYREAINLRQSTGTVFPTLT